MPLSPKLELRQRQSLVMTPQLQQSIKLLQLSSLDLAEYVEQEVAKNPLLEQDETVKHNEEFSEQNTETGDSSEAELGIIELESSVTETPLDIDINEVMEIDEYSVGLNTSIQTVGAHSEHQGLSGLEARFENEIARKDTLRDHLLTQLGEEISDPVKRLIGVQLIDSLNDSGYLTSDLEAIASNIGCDHNLIEDTLLELQDFDPPGVFARDLSECLSIQLNEQDRCDPAMELMIRHLDLVAQNDISSLCKLCSVDAEDIAEMVNEIRGLNPKPGLAFGAEVTQTVVPDVFVNKHTKGGWLVRLNSENLPKVLVNLNYYSKVSAKATNEEDRSYLSENLNAANWLVKALDQRAKTILKVATEIVTQQNGFMADGVGKLRPLNLRDIANKIEMHESTVSRVTANKYIETPRGIYPMKYFFTPAIPSARGTGTHSAESVRAIIRSLIDKEDLNAILSDDKIVEILRTNDIDIARRTVAKYRDAMHIPSSIQRKRQKKS